MEKRIKILVMDVDGTLTDGKIYIGNSGEIVKVFDVKDGYGIRNILSSADIIPVVITGRKSQIVERRCSELEIKEIYQGVAEKNLLLAQILERYGFNYRNVAYMGDDLNDLPCMLAVKEGKGVVGCPADAVKEVIRIADYVSLKNGGDGAVREFIEWLIEEKQEYLI